MSKAIDKAAGAEREVLGKVRSGIAPGQGNAVGGPKPLVDVRPVAVTPEAQKWQGWGTALKPAFEPIVVARKPVEGTVAANVLKWGTGGLNIDGTRVPHSSVSDFEKHAKVVSAMKARGGVWDNSWKNSSDLSGMNDVSTAGRWPANVMLDEYTAALLDEQSGNRPGGTFPAKRGQAVNTSFASGQETVGGQRSMGDSGGASRFFYVAKASKRDRNQGLDELEARFAPTMNDGIGGKEHNPETATPKRNFHPTVKPTTLMRYLVKLVTPPGGTVLDPFTGSGSTGKAAILEGFQFIGVELTEDYLPIIEGRLNHAVEQINEVLF